MAAMLVLYIMGDKSCSSLSRFTLLFLQQTETFLAFELKFMMMMIQQANTLNWDGEQSKYYTCYATALSLWAC